MEYIVQLRYAVVATILTSIYLLLVGSVVSAWDMVDKPFTIGLLAVFGLAIVPGMVYFISEGRRQYIKSHPESPAAPQVEIRIIPIIVEVEAPKRPFINNTTRPLVFMAAGVVIATIISVLLGALFAKKRTSNKS